MSIKFIQPALLLAALANAAPFVNKRQTAGWTCSLGATTDSSSTLTLGPEGSSISGHSWSWTMALQIQSPDGAQAGVYSDDTVSLPTARIFLCLLDARHVSSRGVTIC